MQVVVYFKIENNLDSSYKNLQADMEDEIKWSS